MAGAVAPSVLGNIERAAKSWSEGDDFTAHIHLAHTGLRALDDFPNAAHRLRMAKGALDRGRSPRAVFEALRLGAHYIDALEKRYNPAQPRVPAGHPDGGQWTTGDAVASYKDPLVLSDAPDATWAPGARSATGPRNRGGSGGPILINGQWFELTPGQAARYEVALGRWQYFTTLVRRVDPNWKPTPGWHRPDPEGKITELETEAKEAQERLVEVTGVGATPTTQRGHHYVSRKVFENKPLREDTRKVFEDAASGPLSDPTVNLYSKPHREYNRAVDEAFENFLAERRIEPKNMTPAQARDFLHEVLRSNDLRIQEFNMRIFEQRYLHRKSIFGIEEPDDDWP